MFFLYLCIDGGGTKTAALVALKYEGGSVQYGRGESGPSNLTFGVDHCLTATSLALTIALRELDPRLVDTFNAGQLHFTSVWAGYAGCARPADHALLHPPLSRLLSCPDLRLTSDGELLTAPMCSWSGQTCITLICGTGSLAMLWQRQNNGLIKVGRSGGWGSVLGDEGSGWSLGREGIKSVLNYTANEWPLLPWHRSILAQLKVTDPNLLLATAIALDATVPAGQAESERKRRIAGCARIVVDADDREAERIKRKVAAEVIETVAPLVDRLNNDLSGTILSVTGGLGGSRFWDLVVEMMTEREWAWGRIMYVADPAREGIESLITMV